MNQIVKNYYTIAFKLTGARSIAYFAAISVVTILSIITIDGLGMLLSDILPTTFITQAFAFPYIIFTGTGVFLLNMWAAPQSRFILKETTSTLNYGKVALSLFIPLTVFIYTVISSALN